MAHNVPLPVLMPKPSLLQPDSAVAISPLVSTLALLPHCCSLTVPQQLHTYPEVRRSSAGPGDQVHEGAWRLQILGWDQDALSASLT